ncbi:MAG: hypothetical protein ACLRL6_05880 [Clostridium sp.]
MEIGKALTFVEYPVYEVTKDIREGKAVYPVLDYGRMRGRNTMMFETYCTMMCRSGNVGTIIRTAVSGYDAVAIYSCDVYNEKVIRSTQEPCFTFR